MGDSPEKKYRVRYQDAELPGPSYTRPMTHKEAVVRKKIIEGVADLTAEIVDEDTIVTEDASSFRVEGENKISPEQMLKEAETYRVTAQERVTEDVDASLDEPVETEAEAPRIDTWSQKQNRHTALDHAMKLATVPVGGFSVQTGGPSAEHVIENARKFLAFLNEEGAGA